MTLAGLVKIFFYISTLFYIASMAGYIFYLFRQNEKSQQTAFLMILIGVVFHFSSVFLNILNTGNIPVHNMQQTLSMASLAIAATFIFFTYKYKLKILGVFASCLVSIIMIIAIIISDTPAQKLSILQSYWLWFHIILVFLGEAALALACGTGILYLLQEKGIKEKKQGFFFKRLPSLDLLDSVSYTCIATGFTLLTFGLVTGFLYAKSSLGRFWGWDQKEIWSVGTWIFYAVLLHCRLYSGWRGRQSAIMTIIGLALLVFTFLGVNLLLGGYHQVFTQ